MSAPEPRVTPEHPARRFRPALLLAVGLTLLALQGCDRGADSGATPNPVAPGSPGTGNPVREVSPPGQSGGQSPGVGGSTTEIPPAMTGGSGSMPNQPGSGTTGGLGGANSGGGVPDGAPARAASGDPTPLR